MKSRFTPLGLALCLAGSAWAQFAPMPITSGSYNADVVVEKTATPALKVVTTASVDQGTANGANTWMEVGFDPDYPTNGLPPAGTVITAIDDANYTFKMPPDYTAPNGFLIDTVVSNATITLATPASYTVLSFLGSGGNGGDVIGVTVHHQDGTTESGSFGCPDWFNGTINVAFIANERCGSTVNLGYANLNSNNPRLYFRDVELTNSSPVTTIDLYYMSGSSGSHNDIVAVSGATTQGGAVSPIDITGYTYDFIVEAAAAKRGRVVSTTMQDGTNVWATSQSMDGDASTGGENTGNSWYEQGYNVNNPDGAGAPIPDDTVATTTGLPTAGSSVTNADGNHIYTMPADYTVNNACFLSPSNTDATITFVTPAAESVLSFLASGGNGGGTPVVVVHHQDGSSETGNITVPDWFNTGASYVYGVNGRVDVGSAQFNNVRNGSRVPRIFNCDMILNNSSSPVTSVDVTYTNTGGRIVIFAVSGTTGSVAPSFTVSPQDTRVSQGDNVQLTAQAVANVPITYQWQKGTNGVFADLSNGGNISGVTTTTLSINNVQLADEAQYRCVATDSAGMANSGAALVTVISTLQDVTLPGDSIASFGGSNFGDGPAPNTIDDSVGTPKLGMNLSTAGGPSGFVVTPLRDGPTLVTGIRIYTANDSTGRDPSAFTLEGSVDSGNTYTLIASNTLALPNGRNTGSVGPDPLTQNVDEVDFANANEYTTYRVTFTQYKGGSGQGSMQIGEAELLGTVDTSNPKPFFSLEPASMATYDGDTGYAYFSVFASGTPAPTYQWQMSTGGDFADLSDGGGVSGSQTSYLTITPTSFSDAGDYRCIALNSAGAATSAVVSLTIVSTNTDVTMDTDPIVIAPGDDAAGTANPTNAIDNFNTTTFQCNGSGLNASAGFPPFEGPIRLIVTPSVGETILSGIRIYTSGGNANNDPSDYILEGSNDGGSTYTVISSGNLNLPAARANNALGFDPTLQPMQEILFANGTSYTSYRVTFTHIKGDPNNESNMQFGEMELLGVPGHGAAAPVLAIQASGGGSLTISSTAGGELWSATNLTGTIIWKDEGPISGTTTITPSASEPMKFYQIRP